MPGGRHRSSLRDLGLSGANSPNPYKHGSAKRVVRVLDYSGSEDAQSQGDAAGARRPHRAAIPLASAHAASRPRAARGGRQNLAGIREAFDAEDAENKRKLERLNGRIADLGEGKRSMSMWSLLGQYNSQKPKAAAAAAPTLVAGASAPAVVAPVAAAPAGGDAAAAESKLREREAAVAAKEAAVAKEAAASKVRDAELRAKEAEIVAKAAALDVDRKALEAKEGASARAAAEAREAAASAARAAQASGTARDTALAEREGRLAAREKAIEAREARHEVAAAALSERQAAVAAREARIELASASLDAREAAVKAREAAAPQPPAGGSTRRRTVAAAPAADAAAPAADAAGAEESLAEATAARPAEVGSVRAAWEESQAKWHEWRKGQQGGKGKEEEAAPAPSAAAAAPKVSREEELKEELQKAKARFDEVKKESAKAAGASAAAAPAAAAPKSAAAEAAATEATLLCEVVPEWARTDALTEALAAQSTAAPALDPDAIFFPLNLQRSCELKEVFSDPRMRARPDGSGAWTPLSPGTVGASAAAAAFAAAAGAPARTGWQLVGTDGEYAGERIVLPSLSGRAAKCVVIGRSSSCDVKMALDDQISRRHAQVRGRPRDMPPHSPPAPLSVSLSHRPPISRPSDRVARRRALPPRPRLDVRHAAQRRQAGGDVVGAQGRRHHRHGRLVVRAPRAERVRLERWSGAIGEMRRGRRRARAEARARRGRGAPADARARARGAA